MYIATKADSPFLQESGFSAVKTRFRCPSESVAAQTSQAQCSAGRVITVVDVFPVYRTRQHHILPLSLKFDKTSPCYVAPGGSIPNHPSLLHQDRAHTVSVWLNMCKQSSEAVTLCSWVIIRVAAEAL